jgi:hypothetical protein
MKGVYSIAAGLLVAAFTVAGCGHLPEHHMGAMYTTLIDGEKGLENFDRVGDANWRAEGGAIVADKGKGGHLVSKKSYRNFELRAEFWAETTTQSGIFMRIQDPKNIGSANAYEVNIYDLRPELEYGTAAIVGVASVPVPLRWKAGAPKGGKWNTFHITAKGDELTVVMNGEVTVHTRDRKFAQGPFSLQFGNLPKAPGGPIKWRKVMIREI